MNPSALPSLSLRVVGPSCDRQDGKIISVRLIIGTKSTEIQADLKVQRGLKRLTRGFRIAPVLLGEKIIEFPKLCVETQ